MKKIFVVLVVVALVTLGASAAMANQMNTGCGLGTVIFPNADNLVMELLVTCTNGTLGNQTFGMTTGTLNCGKSSSMVKSEVNEFVASNLDNLATDIAAGQGESIETLAELLEVTDPGFAATLQANFSQIFTSDDVSSAQVVDNIMKVAALS